MATSLAPPDMRRAHLEAAFVETLRDWDIPYPLGFLNEDSLFLRQKANSLAALLLERARRESPSMRKNPACYGAVSSNIRTGLKRGLEIFRDDPGILDNFETTFIDLKTDFAQYAAGEITNAEQKADNAETAMFENAEEFLAREKRAQKTPGSEEPCRILNFSN